MLVLPLVLFLLLFFLYPVAGMLLRSVEPGTWSLARYVELAESSVFWRVMQITLEIGLVVTLACLLLGYPLAYWLARLRPSTANLFMIFVLIPFWTSILVRSYAWMALLERHGVVNNLLSWLHLADTPVKLLNTRFAVCLAMVHVLLPFMVLPLYANLRALDWRLVRAAESLGATPWGTLRQIVWPLSRPGVGAGVTLVFTLAIGFYITPVLVGAPRDVMISMLINDQVGQLAWPVASAMSAVLLVLVLLVTALLTRLTGARRAWAGAA
ncbi:MAG TPA: ABC transporter permease [Acetobacteraceae bacterium]|nr:ABC transporter permease [Acetobacteraceae bacterium]